MLAILRDAQLLRAMSVAHRINQRHFQGRAINYYDVLGVKRHSDTKEIKMAYFKMAKRFHPDFNKTLDAKQMFELIAEAYEVLSDETKRAEYDETGHVSKRYGGRSAEGPARQSTDGSYTAEQMYSKIFNTEQSFDEKEEMPHEDYSVNFSGVEVTKEFIVNITGAESITGTSVVIHVVLPGVCNRCNGSRAELGFQANVCPYCEGTGEETVKTGHIVGRKECSYCRGEKLFIKFKCTECAGIGRILYDIPYNVDIPPGCEHGQVLSVEIDPNLVPQLPENEITTKIIYITVNVQDSPFFTRQGMDLLSNIRLSPSLALLGGKMDYVGLTADCKLNIQPCTSSHTTLVVHRGGVHSEGFAGDHQLTTLIKVPKTLSWWQRRKLQKFATLDTGFTGTIDGVSSDLDHKFSLDLVHATKISNPYLQYCLFNEEKPSLTKRILDVYKRFQNAAYKFAYPSERHDDSETGSQFNPKKGKRPTSKFG